MKAVKLFLVCALFALTGSAFAEDMFSMSFSNVEIAPGGTADLKVTFESQVTMAGWQMFLYLPEGIEILYDEDEEEYAIVLSSLHKKKHGCDVQKASDGSMMLVMTAGTSTVEMSGTSGDLCSITLKASADFSGSSDVAVKKIVISDANAKAYSTSDAQFTITASSTGINEVSGDEVSADGKYLKNGQVIIKKGDKEYNAVGNIMK